MGECGPSDRENEQWRLLYAGYQEVTWMEQQGSSDLDTVDLTAIGSGSRTGERLFRSVGGFPASPTGDRRYPHMMA